MTQYVVVAQGPYDDTMFIIFCVLFLLAAICAVLSKIVSRPRNKILGDLGKSTFQANHEGSMTFKPYHVYCQSIW